MGKIFIGQTALEITINIGADITRATIDFNYKKPNGDTGIFEDSTITIISRLKGVLKYKPQNEQDLDQVGSWLFWVKVTFQDGTVANGETFCKEIFKVGH